MAKTDVPEQLDPKVWAAMKVVVSGSEKTARPGLTPGTHAVDAVVRLKGAIKVAEDTQRANSQKPDLVSLAAVFLLIAPRKNWDKICTQVIEGISPFDLSLDSDPELKSKAEQLIAKLTLPAPSTKSRGAVSGAVEVELVLGT